MGDPTPSQPPTPDSDAARAGAGAVDAANPWPGLESYTESSRQVFFGREQETEEFFRLVRRQTLTVLFGQSGLGKSSLIQAGLFPLLRENDHLPLYLRLDHSPAVASLADQVRAALTATFQRDRVDAPAFRADETLWEYFHRKDVDLWSAKNRLLTPVLAFDQFEEIFTLGRAGAASSERSRTFLLELTCLVENRPPAAVKEKFDRGELDPAHFNFSKPSCQVILSLREDFLPDLEALKQDMPALIHNRLRLKRLNGTQALEIVTRPAPQLLADGVAEKIVEFVAGARGGSVERLAELDVEPPLLSVICRELNERRKALGQPQITADLVSGNRREILTDFYARSVADLPEGVRTFVEDRLLTKSGFRDNLALETALEEPGVTRPLIDTLVSRRLLRLEDRLGVQRVELTHDVLAEVVRASRDARQQRLALEEARRREEEARAESARRSRRQRGVIAGLAAVVIALLIGAYFGTAAQRRSTAQASQTDLVLGSRLLDDGRLAEGLAYLVRSGRKDPNNRLVGPRLLSALSSTSFLLPTAEPLRLPSPALIARYLPDGKRVLVVGVDRKFYELDVEAWQIRTRTDLQPSGLQGFRVAKDASDIVVTVAESSRLEVFRAEAGGPRVTTITTPAPLTYQGRTLQVVLSPDGRWLAGSSTDRAWVWNAISGEQVGELSTGTETPLLSFSPDNRTLGIVRNRGVAFWSLAERAFLPQTVPLPGTTYGLEFSRDSKLLMVVGADGILVADTATGAPVRPVIPLTSTGAALESLQLSQDGSRVLFATGNQTLMVLDVATGKPAYPPLAHGSNVQGFGQVEDGRTIFSYCLDGTVRLWDFASGALLSESILRRPRQPPAVAAPDGRTLVLFTAAGEAFRFRPGGRAAAPLALPRERGSAHFVNLLPDLPARLSWVTPTARLAIDIATGRKAAGSFEFPRTYVTASRATYGSTFGPGEVFVAQSGKDELRLATVGDTGIATDVVFQDPPGPTARSASFAIDSAVRRAALRLENGTSVAIWDTRTGQRVATIATEMRLAPGAFTTATAFSPDGRSVTLLLGRRGGDSIIGVFDVGTQRRRLTLTPGENAGFTSCRYSADGKKILTGDDWGGVQVWDSADGRQLRATQLHRTSVVKFESSPDQRNYASVSSDGSVQVWDALTDLPVGEMIEQSGGASRAEFSPDGTRIATPSRSSHARVWDVQTGLPVTGTLSNEGDPTMVTAFSPDGKFVKVQGGASAVKQLVRLWAVPPASTGRTPDWLLTLATVCAGCRFNEHGKLSSAIHELGKFTEVQEALAAAPDDDAVAEWGRWMLSVDPQRPIAPGFKVTPAEAVTIRDTFNSVIGFTSGSASAAPGPGPVRPR